jgi:hypothetical protein
MAKIIKRKIWWNPVEGEDVVNYKVYTALQGTDFTYDLPAIQVEATITEVLAPEDFPEGTFDIDTNYNVWITAVDDVGNESDPLELNAPFDFVAPSSPSGGGVSSV